MPRASRARSTASDHGSWRLRPVFGLPGLLALRLEGEVDLAACLPAEAEVHARLKEVGWDVDLVLDVRDVTLLSAAGMTLLTRLADRLADGGRRLLLVAGSSPARSMLQAAHAGDVLEVFPTLDTALSALPSTAEPRTGPAVDAYELERLRTQVRDLRDKLSTRPLVARALGMLQERYGLEDMAAANTLLRRASQHHNVRMRELAAAFVVAKPPLSATAQRWFPGRVRRPAPPVTFAPVRHDRRAMLLDVVLEAALSGTTAAGGSVCVFDAARGDQVVERRRGLTPRLVEILRDSNAWPVAHDRPITVDVRDDESFTPCMREILLDAGVRVVLCVPLTSHTGPMGTVSTLHADPGPCAADIRHLERVGAEAGAWLEWYTRTVTVDALEHLHELARVTGRG